MKINPLEIPLKAYPGEAPKLENELGNVSFSHSIDALLIGWSRKKLGIDIEKKDRVIKSNRIIERFFNLNDKEHLKKFNGKDFIAEVISQWVIKESLINTKSCLGFGPSSSTGKSSSITL